MRQRPSFGFGHLPLGTFFETGIDGSDELHTKMIPNVKVIKRDFISERDTPV